MAVQAPLHLQRVFLVHERHLVDRAVTTKAANTFVYVNTVIEIDKIREIMDPRPLDGSAAAEAVAYRFQHGRIGPDQGMTIHAGLGRRDSRKAGLLNRSVAVTAVQAQAGDVVLVAEGDGLLRRDVLPGHIRRALQFQQRRSHPGKKKNNNKNARPGERICTAVKDLCHDSSSQEPSCSTYLNTSGSPQRSSAIYKLKMKTDDYNKSGKFSQPFTEEL